MKRLAVVLLCALPLFASPPPLPRETIDKRLARATRGNSARRAELVRLFRDSGCRSLTEQSVPGHKLPNVICTIGGATDRTILVTAHYDMRGPGLGVADNWGGTSLLPSLHQIFASAKPRHTLVFIGFAEEEKGLLGAKAYLRAADKSGQVKNIAAMINMDGVGMASTRVWHTKSDGALVERLHTLARELNVEVTESSLDGSGIMDSFPFHERNVPVLSLHGLAPGNYHRPHTRFDDAGAVDGKHLYDSYRLVARMIDTLDREL